MRRIRQLLASARAAPRESNPVVAALAVRRLLGQRGLVIYLSDLEESEAAGQLMQATRLLAPKHLPLIGSLEDPAEMRLRRAAPHTWLAPYRRLAALELARERLLTARRVTAQGARVVTARPEHLTDELLATYDQLRQRRAV